MDLGHIYKVILSHPVVNLLTHYAEGTLSFQTHPVLELLIELLFHIVPSRY